MLNGSEIKETNIRNHDVVLAGKKKFAAKSIQRRQYPDSLVLFSVGNRERNGKAVKKGR